MNAGICFDREHFSAVQDIKLRTNVMIIIALASGFHSSLTKTGT